MNNTKMMGELPELLAMSTSILIVIILQYSAVAAGNLYFLSERLDGKIKTPPDSNTQVAVSLLQCSALASQQNLPGISYNTVSQACYMYLTCLQVSDGSLIQENGWRHYCTDSVPEAFSPMACHYKLLSGTMGWIEAKAECIRNSGYLLEIHSEEEANFVETNIFDTGSCTGSIYWLGGLKNSSKVTWVTSKSDVPVLPEQGYSKWSTHEPTLDVTGFDCMLWVFTGWKVYTCNEPKCTICKADDCIY